MNYVEGMLQAFGEYLDLGQLAILTGRLVPPDFVKREVGFYSDHIAFARVPPGCPHPVLPRKVAVPAARKTYPTGQVVLTRRQPATKEPAPMYLSIRDALLPGAGFSTIGEGLRKLGLSAVEISVARDMTVPAIEPVDGKTQFVLDSPVATKAYADYASECGVRIAALLTMNKFGGDDNDEQVEWVTRTVRAADALGVEAVRIDSIMIGERERPLEERVAVFTDCVKRVLAATDGLNVDIGVENHGWGGNDPAFLDAVLERVASDRFGVTLDTGNFYWRGHPLDAVYAVMERLAPVTKHTHVKAIKYPEEIRNQERECGFQYGTYVCPIAEGDIDHARVIQWLKAAGYDRDFCLEDESLGKFPQQERAAVLAKDVQYCKELL